MKTQALTIYIFVPYKLSKMHSKQENLKTRKNCDEKHMDSKNIRRATAHHAFSSKSQRSLSSLNFLQRSKFKFNL